jgi:hypothetical protein
MRKFVIVALAVIGVGSLYHTPSPLGDGSAVTAIMDRLGIEAADLAQDAQWRSKLIDAEYQYLVDLSCERQITDRALTYPGHPATIRTAREAKEWLRDCYHRGVAERLTRADAKEIVECSGTIKRPKAQTEMTQHDLLRDAYCNEQTPENQSVWAAHNWRMQCLSEYRRYGCLITKAMREHWPENRLFAHPMPTIDEDNAICETLTH